MECFMQNLLYRRRSRIAWLSLPILTLLTAACSSLLDSTQDYADNATIEVTGTSPVPLLLVSSTNWVYVPDPVTGEPIVSTTTADTVSLQLPINRTVALTNSYRIFFQLINRDSAQTASVRMRVRLDDKMVYDQAANMRNASLEFSFAYGNVITQ
jgi:hypothetical protein